MISLQLAPARPADTIVGYVFLRHSACGVHSVKHGCGCCTYGDGALFYTGLAGLNAEDVN